LARTSRCATASGVEICPRDLLDAEAAHGLERQHGLLVALERGVAGDEHQRQRIVEPAERFRPGESQPPGRALVERRRARLVLQPVERLVARGDREPRGRPVGNPVGRPARQRHAEGVLDRILDQFQARRAQEADEPRRELSGLAPEQRFDKLVRRVHHHHTAST